ncbi:exostosin-2-like [Paramacrobiotus metropolitanus]|uniref:exostosin-2-like n=1 Tax=Paramacrobiotus metropolitanus TaxID=2943436 RepID=UPI002445A7F5|nr:exostosin-2-like [Paramacrobiotus metropolitanus]XP_055335548.1 exostosin-2-like [Paramacrobiotus metropolitanus]
MKTFWKWWGRWKTQFPSKHHRWKTCFRRFLRRRRWLLLLLFFATLCGFLIRSAPEEMDIASYPRSLIGSHGPVTVQVDGRVVVPTKHDCSHFSCFDVYRCNALNDYRSLVFFYPDTQFYHRGKPLNSEASSSFHAFRSIVKKSVFNTESQSDACIFIPPVDFLYPDFSSARNLSLALAALKRWNDGSNSLIFTLKPRASLPTGMHLGAAMVAAPGFTLKSYRKEFDISVPYFHPAPYRKVWPNRSRANRRWMLTLITVDRDQIPDDNTIVTLMKSQSERMLRLSLRVAPNGEIIGACKLSDVSCRYPEILLDSHFCIIAGASAMTLLGDLLMMGCIPVIANSAIIMPFADNLDWPRSAVFLRPDQPSDVIERLQAIDKSVIGEMRQIGLYFWEQYFSSMEIIVETVLQALNDRIFPKAAKSYEQWNLAAKRISHQAPLFLPGIMPKSLGFTTVILTFDRLPSLFQLISHVAKCPSLAKILVMWNDQDAQPPSAEKWPQINKPLKVLQTKDNDLNNRFLPYDDIETEAILNLDDDILMLTVDEIEFGYQVWLEHSDRLVGFPSRLHLWNGSNHAWEYSSEWSSRLSIVLTGAAFYNKVYNQYYSFKMPRSIRDFVREHKNCEDIAMNFLIANLTGKAPLKVGPRKKFRCPECSNMDMLSADAGHLLERSHCINFLISVYGYLPLLTVEYRADPTLYKESVHHIEEAYPHIGAL